MIDAIVDGYFPVLESFGKFKEDVLNPAVFGLNNKEAVRIMDRAGWR